jgi:hypothetical protein
MKTPAATGEPRNQTTGEAAGYITGVLVSMLRWFMPLRLWLTITASAALLIFICRTEDPLQIARATSGYVVFVGLITVGSISRKSR